MVPGSTGTTKISKKQIRVSITPDNDIPAFAGYLSGSIDGPEAIVVVNFEAIVNASAEHDIPFDEIFVPSVVHEMLHAVQDLYHREFDEEEVEQVIEEALLLQREQRSKGEQ